MTYKHLVITVIQTTMLTSSRTPFSFVLQCKEQSMYALGDTGSSVVQYMLCFLLKAIHSFAGSAAILTLTS